MPKHEAVTDDELVAAIDFEVSNADYEGQSQISEQRSEADLAYTGQYTNGTFPTTGMSSILINTLQPAVDTLTTYLTKIFCSDQETVVFSSHDEKMAEMAREITRAVNDVIYKENDGYEVINRWIKDAALHKNGIVKVVWDDTPVHHKELFEGSEEELNVVVSTWESEGYDVDVMDKENVTDVLEVEDEEGNKLEVEEKYISATLKMSKPRDMPKILNIPPEEFLINEGATGINNDQLTRYVGHRQLVYLSDVLQMFPDVDEEYLYSSAATGYLENEFETDIRHYFDNTYDQYDYESNLRNLKQVEIVESWIRADRDGDGLAEWRHCFTVGRTLLMDEEWFGPIPMCSFSFFPIPHKFFGLGLWDKLRDYHRTKTGLMRSIIDNAVQANTFRIIADPRMIDTRDLKSGRPGVIKALPNFDPKSVMPLNVQQGNPAAVTSVLEYLDKEIIAQIGIDPVTGMVSTDIEKSGNDAAKTAQTIDNASAKVETFAREFAETGLRDMIFAIYDLQIQKGNLPDVGMGKADLKAKVGLGHQTTQQKVAAAQTIIQQQMAMEQSPTSPVIIPADKKLNAAKHLAKSLGEEDPSMFFPTMEEVAQAQQAQQQQQAQLLQQQQQMQGAQMQEEAANNEFKRKLDEANAMKAMAEAENIGQKLELESEEKVVEIENVKQDNELNVRRQEAQEEQMVANLELQRDNQRLQKEIAELKARTDLEKQRMADEKTINLKRVGGE